MENLTKHQLILVALLISFVTSIATGIVTVSLMDQAPKAVTQTINRVVEKTVERVITEPNKNKDIIKETIVVKEEDKVIEAIEKNVKSMVRIYKTSSTGADSMKSFVGIGILISKDGDIVTDKAIVSSSDSYSAVLNNGQEYNLKLSQEIKPIAFLKIIPKDNERLSVTPAILADSNTLKLGQTVISLGGELRNSIAIGVMTSFIESNDLNPEQTTPESIGLSVQKESTTTISMIANTMNLTATIDESIKKDSALTKENKELIAVAGKTLSLIETNIISDDSNTGNPLINLSSEVVGIRVKLSNKTQKVSFVPINEVKKSFSSLSVVASSTSQISN